MKLSHYYRQPALSPARKNGLLSAVRQAVLPGIKDIETEYCFNVGTTDALSNEEQKVLQWLLAETFEPEHFSEHSFLTHPSSPTLHPSIIEVGPRMNFTTAWSTNAVSVCHACGLTKITRIERSRRYKLIFEEQGRGERILSLEPLAPRILESYFCLSTPSFSSVPDRSRLGRRLGRCSHHLHSILHRSSGPRATRWNSCR
jgi:phosphoribosylformylglycinamidine synthase